MAVTGSELKFPGRWGGLALTVAAVLTIFACRPASFDGNVRPTGGPTQVIGTLVVGAAAGERSRVAAEIELPDAKVFLVDQGGNRAAEALTQLDGRFELLAAAPGQYRFCYEIGPTQACGPRVSALGDTVLLGPVPVASRSFIHGQVLTADGRPCWVADSFFGLDVSTRVSAAPAVTGGTPSAGARANVQGEYALFGLTPGRYAVTAECENARITDLASLGQGLARRDLTLPNHAPVVRTAAAFAGPRNLLRAVPGATVDLRSDVVDRDGDTIQYMWRALDGSGQVVDPAVAGARWQLAADEGLRSVYLMARDGRGGFAFRRIDIEGGRSDRVSASGRAIDEATGAPVPGAAVTFGSASGRTDANGWFTIESERRDDSRYVLNIRHPDYALSSRILDRNARGDTYQMTPVQAGITAAGAQIRLLDRASGSMCGNRAFQNRRPLLRRAARRLLEAAGRFGVDPSGIERLLALVRATEPRCMPRGAEIVLPAGALADARGFRADGPVRGTVATLNPARRALPGDYSAVPRGGGTTALLSFGAVDVRFTDSAGRALNLRPGVTAEVRMPVAEGQLATAPPTMKMWSYDEEQGRWIDEGDARLVRTAEGAFYVGETRHFSTINMDIELNRPNATCVRFELDPAFSAWSNLTLRAYASFGGTSSQVKEVLLNSNQYHAVFALPYGPGNTLRVELRGTFNGVVQVLLDDIIVLAPPRPQMTGAALFPPDPYVECGAPELLSPAQGVLPFYGVDATGRPRFLTGPYGTFNPNPAQGAAYYGQIDPGSTRTTLAGWWSANGFDANGQGGGNSTYTRAAYMNHNDLGFGRDMHCLQPGGGKLACYVTNYGLPDQNGQNANAAATQDPVRRGATVAMEFDPNAANNTNVRFYVFNGGVGAATRVQFADLDGFGPKPVPHLCMTCHGGRFVANEVEYARFREFDLPSFRYLNGQTWDHGQPNPPTLGLDATAFARLNDMVRTAHPGTPIAALINNWYLGNFGPGALPGVPAPPSGWASQPNGYHSVYGRTCRTCHVARDRGNPNAFLVLGDATTFNSLGSYVCGSGSPKLRVMPNAFITYRNFWADTLRVQLFEALTSTSNCGS